MSVLQVERPRPGPSGATFAAFADFLTKSIIDRASGRTMPDDSPDGARMVWRRPADAFFVGSLGPANAVEQGRPDTAPPAMGMDFFVRELDEIRVQGSFQYYVAEPPNYSDCLEAGSQTSEQQIDLPIALRRFAEAFDHAFMLAIGTSSHPITISHRPGPDSYGAPSQALFYKLDRQALDTEQSFSQALRNASFKQTELVHSASLSLTVTEDALRGYRVQVRIVNESSNTRWSDPKQRRRIDRYEEPFLFDVNLTVFLGTCTLEPTFLALEANEFRYDNRLWAEGFNAAAEYDDTTKSIRTRYAPIARQRRVRHASGREDLSFETVATDGIPQLRTLLEEMKEFAVAWPPSTQSDPVKRIAEERDRERFAKETARFEHGISEIEHNTNALAAFRATMKTFAAVWVQRDPGQLPAWRRFQMVFIVSVIGGLCGRVEMLHPDLDVVDILWFPTGGGKTEAYLAIMIWQAFFDRARGKTAGVTALMRFPLRLLSLQQMQRVIEAVAVAETIRASASLFKGDPFTVGFLVGKNVTRNKLEDEDVRELLEQLRLPFAQRSDWARRHRVVAECPFCHAHSVDIRVERGRLFHYCTASQCGKVLPLLIIDDEVYRYLPTVLVGTIDKLALIGQNIRWRQLLGFVDTYCSLHGYSSGGKCMVYKCNGSTRSVRLVDPAPAIEIQDELHLLREDLGVLASHYETVAHAIAQKYGLAPMKVIASTATIQDHERHSRALYARDSRQFPAMGPTDTASFYAQIQGYDQRLFVGIMPRRLAHINALMQLMQIEHELLQRLRDRTFAQSVVPDELLDDVLDYYEVVVTYTLRRVDQERVDGSIDSQVNPYLQRRGLRPIRNQPMTADTTSEQVAAVLHALESPPAQVDQRITSVTATSMISHGVDVDRLNIMNFFGMPASTAEYIQSSSRVGRKVCGCVFVVYQAHKERERSHYNAFLKYHELENMLVEPVPLNRWATNGLQHTAPGLIMAAIFGLFGERWAGKQHGSLFKAKEVLRAIDQRAFSIEEVVDSLLMALHVEAVDRTEVHDYLESVIRGALDQARISDKNRGFGACMSPEPMQSLRDVEESFPVDIAGPNTWFAERD
jgi:Helicase conserved C-terminal domain